MKGRRPDLARRWGRDRRRLSTPHSFTICPGLQTNLDSLAFVNAQAKALDRSIGANWAHILRTCSCDDPRGLDPVGRFLVITRACVQPMTLISVAIAGLLAASTATFDVLLFLLAAIGSVVAHAANNMINDLFDLEAGLDEKDYPRAQYAPHPVLAGLIDRRGLVRAILIANFIDAAIMVFLFMARGWPILAFALIGLFISVFYVAPPLRLKYHGLGEAGVFVIWGPVMVGGTYYAATGALPIEVLFASIPYALLVTTVLMGKHVDKAPWDRKEGVKTLPVLLGDVAARRATAGLLIAYYASIVILVVARVLSPWTLLVLLALPVLRKALRTYSRPKPEKPPARFPVWPLWYGPWAFVHSERAGALFVLGLLVGVLL